MSFFQFLQITLLIAAHSSPIIAHLHREFAHNASNICIKHLHKPGKSNTFAGAYDRFLFCISA